MLIFTGYKPCTYNLDKLRRYTRRFSIGLATLFPGDTPEEDHYFKLLASAYVDARYKKDYPISACPTHATGQPAPFHYRAHLSQPIHRFGQTGRPGGVTRNYSLT